MIDQDKGERKEWWPATYEILSRSSEAFASWRKEHATGTSWPESNAYAQLAAIADDVASGHLALAFDRNDTFSATVAEPRQDNSEDNHDGKS